MKGPQQWVGGWVLSERGRMQSLYDDCEEVWSICHVALMDGHVSGELERSGWEVIWLVHGGYPVRVCHGQ